MGFGRRQRIVVVGEGRGGGLGCVAVGSRVFSVLGLRWWRRHGGVSPCPAARGVCGGWGGGAVTGWVEMGVEGPQVGVGLSLLRRPSTATMLRCKGSR